MKIQKNQHVSNFTLNPMASGQSVKSGLFSNMLGQVDRELAPPPVEGIQSRSGRGDSGSLNEEKNEAAEVDQSDEQADASDKSKESSSESEFADTLSAEQIKAINPDTFSLDDIAAIQALGTAEVKAQQSGVTADNSVEQSASAESGASSSGKTISQGGALASSNLISGEGVNAAVDLMGEQKLQADQSQTAQQNTGLQSQQGQDTVTLESGVEQAGKVSKTTVVTPVPGANQSDKSSANAQVATSADVNAEANAGLNSAAFDSFADDEQAESRQYEQQKASTNVDFKQNESGTGNPPGGFGVSSAVEVTSAPKAEVEVKVTPDVVTTVNTGTTVSETPVKIEQATPQQGVSESDTQQIVDKTIRGLKSVINQKGGSVTIRLTPVELGAMRIRVNMEGGTINAQLEVAKQSTRQLLQQQLTTLRQTLESQGFVIEQLNINHTPALDDQAQTQTQKEQENESQSRDSRKGHAGDSQQREGQAEAQAKWNDFEQELLDLIV